MPDPLALRYRPRTFKDMVGQLPVQTVLHYMIHEQVQPGQPTKAREVPTVPHGLLFTGVRGTGKTTAARVLSAALNCSAPGRRPCTTCASCESVAAQTSTAVMELDAASNGLVADIRRLTEMVSYDSGSPYRTVILDEAHGVSREGFNALLKTLEEPPDRTVFILVTTEYAKIPGTIASRCMPFSFRRISPDAILKRLQFVIEDAGLPQVEEELLAELADRADGAMRDALMLLEQVSAAGVTSMAQFMLLTGMHDFAPLLLTSCAMGDHSKLFSQAAKVLSQTGDIAMVAAQLVRCLRDVLVLHAGGVPAVQGATLERRKQLAAMVSAPAALAALRVLWDLQTKVRATDPRATLELALVMCSQALCPGNTAERQVTAPRSVNGHTPNQSGNGHLSLTQARELLSAWQQ